MNIPEKLIELRRIMDRENIAAYIISGTDPHNSEYLPAPWQQMDFRFYRVIWYCRGHEKRGWIVD